MDKWSENFHAFFVVVAAGAESLKNKQTNSTLPPVVTERGVSQQTKGDLGREH